MKFSINLIMVVMMLTIPFFQSCSHKYTNTYSRSMRLKNPHIPYQRIYIHIEFTNDSTFYYTKKYYLSDQDALIYGYYDDAPVFKLFWHNFSANGRKTEYSDHILLDCKYYNIDPEAKELTESLSGYKSIERATIYLQKKGKNKLDLNGITLKRQRIKSNLEYKIKRQFTQIKRKLRYLFSYYPAPQKMDAAHYLSLEYDTCHPLDRDTNYIYNVTELRHTSLHSAMDLLKSSPDADPADASRIRRSNADGCGFLSMNNAQCSIHNCLRDRMITQMILPAKSADGCGTKSSNLTHETMDAIENSSQGYSLSQVEGDIGNPTLVDIVDEVYAYKAQYAYDATSMNGINPKKKTASIHDINSTYVRGIKSRNKYIYPTGSDGDTAVTSVGVNTPGAHLMMAYPWDTSLRAHFYNTNPVHLIYNIYFKK